MRVCAKATEEEVNELLYNSPKTAMLDAFPPLDLDNHLGLHSWHVLCYGLGWSFVSAGQQSIQKSRSPQKHERLTAVGHY